MQEVKYYHIGIRNGSGHFGTGPDRNLHWSLPIYFLPD